MTYLNQERNTMPKSFNPAKPASVYAVRHKVTKKFVIRPQAHCRWTKNPSTYTNMVNAEYALLCAADQFGLKQGEFEIVEYEVTIKEVATHHQLPPSDALEDQS